MKIERVDYRGFEEAYRCTIGEMSLVVVCDKGPRIISLSVGNGANIFYEDIAERYVRGQWHLIGGHRFWVGPETENAFFPENAPCQVQIENGTISVSQQPDPMGLQRTLQIGEDSDDKIFSIRHIVTNAGSVLMPGTIWTLTCSRPRTTIVPWASGSKSWQSNLVRYWTCWDGHTTDPASQQWNPNKDYFLVNPTGEEGKIGLFSECGYFASLGEDYTFVKTYRPQAEATYPDGGVNIEIYTCPDFIEMETLSPNYVFHPGRTYVHEEKWLITPKTFTAANYSDIEQMFTSKPGTF